MIIDQLALLSDQQAVTASAASANCLDLGAPGVVPYGSIQLKRKLGGAGCPIPLLIQVVQDFATLTSLTVTVQSDDNSSFSSPKDIISHTAGVADLKAGFIFPIDKLPVVKEQFVRLYFTVGGSNATAGKITAGIVGAAEQQSKNS